MVIDMSPLKKDELLISLAADSDYFVHLFTCVASVLENCSDGRRLRFLILNGGLLSHQLDSLKSFVTKNNSSVYFCSTVSNIYHDFPIKKTVATAPTYYRISLAELLPAHIKKVLYLDCDIVMEDDILKLQEYPFESDISVLAVEDISTTNAYRTLGISKNRYFNAGVLLINLEYWRRHNVGKAIREFKLKNTELILGNDGGAINGVLSESWGRLPPRWNQQSGIYRSRFRKRGRLAYSFDEIREAVVNPAVIHYIGSRKPWIAGCPHPLRQRYWEYRRLCGTLNSKPTAPAFLEELRAHLKKPQHFLFSCYRKLRFSNKMRRLV